MRGSWRCKAMALLSFYATFRMNYFKPHYKDLRWPIKDGPAPGMRQPQLGALHAIGAHFSRHRGPAIVTMPTGSGKTAVISAVPFLLRAERVLVLTPSRMVREQIAEEFRGLIDLKILGVLDANLPTPSVCVVESKITDFQEWLNFRPYDVVIGIPNSISLEIEGVPPPPLNFFDVVLVDEAHHAAARSWRGLLEQLSLAKQVMFTATPFRRDRLELIGKLVYVYELRDAYHDGVFGQLEYQPVLAGAGDTDLAIAHAAAARLRSDQASGLAHLIMVRTGTKARAAQLANLYQNHTDLKLQVVTSDHSLKRLRKVVEQLRDKALDGIVCVDMLGEGFNLPNLKIAALHTPHRSLAVTLQFIGRFARTNAPDLGSAVFFALESDMEVEKQKLYDQGAAWEEIIPNLSSEKVLEEEQTREVLGTFQAAAEPDQELDLSLYSLRPYHHVKVLSSPQPIDISKEIEPPPGFGIVHRHVSIDEATAVYILRCRVKPEWTSVEHLDTVSHELLILYFHQSTGLLFVCSSLRTDGLYDHIADQFGGTSPLRGLAFKKVNRVLLDLEELRFFNIGMRTIGATRPSESYRTIAGPNVDEAIELSDRREFRRGHWFGSAKDNGAATTIGLSVASKVWSNSSSQIPRLIAWCNRLASKISSERTPHTNSGLDHLATGDELTAIPENVVYVDWNESTYYAPCRITFVGRDGTSNEGQLLDMDLVLDRRRSTDQRLGLKLVADQFSCNLTFALDGNPIFFEQDPPEGVDLEAPEANGGIAAYLNHHLPTFFTADCGSFEGCNYFDPPNPDAPPFDPARIETIESDENVDIQTEFGTAAQGKRSIHTYIQERLLASPAQIVLYDHGTGELADFVALESRADDVLVSLFHCKGSSTEDPGERVEDLYEVCGQAVKSARWVNRKPLIDALHRRTARGSVFVRGSLEESLELLDDRFPISLQIVLVQPGLRKASVRTRTSPLLGAVDDFVRGGRCNRIRVIASG
jgi:superfamily II DNA or RNA helicase